jgi:PAS domain S-box-containing protein
MLNELRKPVLRFLDGVSAAIVAADGAGRIVYANGAALQLFGTTAEDVIGRTLSDTPRRAEAAAARDLLKSWSDGESRAFYMKIPVAGSRGMARLFGIPALIRDPGGRFVGVVICFVPVEDLQRAAQSYVGVVSSLARESLASLAFEFRSAESEMQKAAPIEQLRSSSRALRALSDREWDVARLLLEGLRPSSIATRLGVAVSTVRNHLKSIYRKSGVTSQVGFVAKVRDVRADEFG